ncbi:MAG: hypothetical protein RI560_12415, partial [Natronomonas sp.]|nr:hypothetical protein [Natronomonas sp.]
MSIASSKRGAQVERWIRKRVPAVIAGLSFVVLWWVLATVIDNNRIFASISYTWSSLAEQGSTISLRLTETFTSIVVAFILAAIFGIVLGLVIAEVFTLRQMVM